MGKIPLEKEMTTHSSVLPWRTPWTEEAGGLQSVGSQRVDRVANSNCDENAAVGALLPSGPQVLVPWNTHTFPVCNVQHGTVDPCAHGHRTRIFTSRVCLDESPLLWCLRATQLDDLMALQVQCPEWAREG